MMELEEITRTGIGAAASFAAGFSYRYLLDSIADSTFINATKAKEDWRKYNPFYLVVWGAVPVWVAPPGNNTVQFAVNYAANVAGAFLGNLAGKWVLKRRDSKPFLTDEEKAEIEERRKRLKQLARLSPDQLTPALEDLGVYLGELATSKRRPEKVAGLAEELSEDVCSYAASYASLMQFVAAPKNAVAAIIGHRTRPPSAAVYILTDGNLDVHDMRMSPVGISGDGIVFGVGVDKNPTQTISLNDDYDRLAEMIAKEDRIILLAKERLSSESMTKLGFVYNKTLMKLAGS